MTSYTFIEHISFPLSLSGKLWKHIAAGDIPVPVCPCHGKEPKENNISNFLWFSLFLTSENAGASDRMTSAKTSKTKCQIINENITFFHFAFLSVLVRGVVWMCVEI